MKFKPKDIVACLVIIGYFVAKWLKFDGQVDGAFLLIVGYYFTKRQEGKDNGQ